MEEAKEGKEQYKRASRSQKEVAVVEMDADKEAHEDLSRPHGTSSCASLSQLSAALQSLQITANFKMPWIRV
jgi:hypothetical protein